MSYFGFFPNGPNTSGSPFTRSPFMTRSFARAFSVIPVTGGVSQPSTPSISSIPSGASIASSTTAPSVASGYTPSSAVVSPYVPAGASTSGETIVRTEKVVGGSTIEKTSIVKRWTTMSRNKKLVLGAYAGTVLVSYVSSIYKDGYDALVAHRNEIYKSGVTNQKSTPETFEQMRNNEYNAVVKGCKSNSLERFWESLICPYTFISSAIPSIIIRVHGSKDDISQ
ncbi:hypothetical protein YASMINEVIRUS_365 [Yasminevirus sp. GU-2018]|uniref:Uncharacterized protein n=1 Tax=Yasminevirus sp. GU-2018 TaxID=2420051 RepID=A0A5K0U914_9VIRU|nr:hypothetical protein YASMINEVIRUS_365 [Yasminevirus sp. GU-2018]